MADCDFNTILQQAAALKSYSQAPFRKRYDSFPPWYQHTLFSSEDLIQLRESGDAESMIAFASESKTKGNSLYNTEHYLEASVEYENALGVFNWLEPLDEDWMKKDFDDERILERSFESSDEALNATGRNLRLSCLLNIARCYQNLLEWPSCITACDFALAIDPESVKALYLRSQARSLPVNCGAFESDQAMADLKLAYELAPKNVTIAGLHTLHTHLFTKLPSLQPCFNYHPSFSAAYKELRSSTQRQAKKDREMFGGLFNRGSVSKSSASSSGSGAVAETMTIKEALEKINDAEAAAGNLERLGRVQEAYNIRERVKDVRAQYTHIMDEHRRARLDTLKGLDFLNPTPEMITNAAAAGIDMNDVRVRRILHELQTEKGNDEKTSMSTIFDRVIDRIGSERAMEVAVKLVGQTSQSEMERMVACRLKLDPTLAQKIRKDKKQKQAPTASESKAGDDDDDENEEEDTYETLLALIANDLRALQMSRGGTDLMIAEKHAKDESLRLLEAYGCAPPLTHVLFAKRMVLFFVISLICTYAFVNTSSYMAGFREKYLYGKGYNREVGKQNQELANIFDYMNTKQQGDSDEKTTANDDQRLSMGLYGSMKSNNDGEF